MTTLLSQNGKFVIRSGDLVTGDATSACCSCGDPCPFSPYPILTSFSDSVSLSGTDTIATPGSTNFSDGSETNFRVPFETLPTITITKTVDIPTPAMGYQFGGTSSATIQLREAGGSSALASSVGQSLKLVQGNFDLFPLPNYVSTIYNLGTYTIVIQVVSYNPATGAAEIYTERKVDGLVSSATVFTNVSQCGYFKLLYAVNLSLWSIDFTGVSEYALDTSGSIDSSMTMAVT